jgi:Cys-rich repeat protein
VPVRDELVGGLDMNAGRENCSSCRVAPNQCTRDADCGNGAFCLRTEREDYDETIIGHWCQTPCATDGDCGAGFVCVCDRVVQNATRLETTLGICKPGTCRTDTDCGVGSFCVSPLNSPAESGRDAEPVLEAFHCQTSEHECFSSWQCPDAPDGEDCPPFSTCEESDGRFVCGFRYESIACSF